MTMQEYVEQLLDMLSINGAVVTVDEQEEAIVFQIDLPEDEAGLLIGYHGESMVAMQRMIRVVFHDQTDKRVVINVNDYRQQREAKIVDRATEIAYRVLESGRPYRFGPMPANERFVIHTTISENPEFVDLVSYSEGEGAARQLIIAPKEAIAVD